MPDRTAALIAADARIRATIMRLETRRMPKGPAGLRLVTPQRERVTGQIVREVAWPRYLVWHSYIMSQVPTSASVTVMAHRLHGHLLYRAALWCQAHGLPLPTKDHTTPPAWAMQPYQTLSITRAVDDGGDPEAYWDDYGDWPDALEGLTPQEIAAWGLESSQQASDSATFDAWIANEVMTDLGVLQVLSQIWNGSAAQLAMGESLGAMGITGSFDLVDPTMMSFLQNQAGLLVGGQANRLASAERNLLQQALFEGLGGADGGVGLAMPGLARMLQDAMAAYGGALADMSSARAMMIAVTETARAETIGQFASMLATGAQQKQWIATAGACQICAENESVSPIGIMEEFPSGGLAPPIHPLCRCSIAAYVDPTAPFDPKQWANAPGQDAINSFFSDPAWALWPQIPDGVDMSALRATQPTPNLAAEWARGSALATRIGAVAQRFEGQGDTLDELAHHLTPAQMRHAASEIRQVIVQDISDFRARSNYLFSND
jgi:hypothetical protein